MEKKYRGVSRMNSRWRAQVTVGRRPIFCGSYGSELEAAEAYDRHAVAYLGEKARSKVNFEANFDRLLLTVERIDPPRHQSERRGKREQWWLMQVIDDTHWVPCEHHLLYGGKPCARWATVGYVRNDRAPGYCFCSEHAPPLIKPQDQVVFL